MVTTNEKFARQRKEQVLNVQIRITRGGPYLHTEKHSIVKVHMQSIKMLFCSLLKVITGRICLKNHVFNQLTEETAPAFQGLPAHEDCPRRRKQRQRAHEAKRIKEATCDDL
jgi:hypothetical protein